MGPRHTPLPAALASLLTVAACATNFASPDSAPDTLPATPPGPRAEAPAQHCATDGTLQFRVRGRGLAAYDGARIHAAAVEPHAEGGSARPTRVRRPVRISTTIADGRFELACPSALQPTLHYPSWGLWIDVDGDGVCGGADLGAFEILYGWGAIDAEVGPGTHRERTEHPLAPLPTHDTEAVCAKLFPPSA